LVQEKRPSSEAPERLESTCAPDAWWRDLDDDACDEFPDMLELQDDYAEALRAGAVPDAARPPSGVRREAWLAAQAVGVLQEARLLVAAISEVSKRGSRGDSSCCPAEWGCNSAIEYMRKVVLDMRSEIACLVPKTGSNLPSCFVERMRVCFRHVLNIYVYTYVHHFSDVRQYGAETHLLSCFARFLHLAREFDFVSEEELAPLRSVVDLIDNGCDGAGVEGCKETEFTH
jgi:hypothetical protein